MNATDTKSLAACVVCTMAAAWPLMVWGAPEDRTADLSPASHAAPSQAEYTEMLQEAERARVQAEAARQEAEKAAQQARETAQRHAEQARREAEAERQEAMAEAQRARDRAQRESERVNQLADREREELEQARQQAEEERERARALRQEEMERIREELSKAHRELREATREIARAHRDVGRTTGPRHIIREINLGDRAVIGVILGPETAEGVKVIGVSPGGPADIAGLQAGDVIVSIRGESLAPQDESGGRAALYRVMDDARSGETLALVVDRDGATWNFDVTAEQREPSSWQTMIRIPEAAEAPSDVQVAPQVLVERLERIEIPDVDEEALHDRVHELTERLESRKFTVVVPEGHAFDLEGDFKFPESFDLEFREYSEFAERAFDEANIWFGLPQSQGLELARVNESLGAYFETDRGVLVLEASEDNAYSLQAGDVVLEVNEKPVDSPADLMRALREIETGKEVRFAIMRDRKSRSIAVTMPDSRLGYAGPRGASPKD